MSATIGAAVKAYLESPALNLGLSASRDVAGEEQKPPYIVVHENLGMALDGSEDGAAGTGTEALQMELWQYWRDPDPTSPTHGKVMDSATLPDAITQAIHGSVLLTTPPASVPPKKVYGVLQKNRIRDFRRDENLVRYIYDLDIKRKFA